MDGDEANCYSRRRCIWWHWPSKTIRHHQFTSYIANILTQPLSLLLKACKEVDHLSLYDVVNTPGVTADLSHISSVAKIEGYLPADDGMKKAFTGADMVIIPAGIPRKLSLHNYPHSA